MGVDDNYVVASRGRNPENPNSRESGLNTEQRLEPRTDGKTNCLTSVQKDNLVMQLNPSKESGGKQPYQQNRVYADYGKMTCLDTDSGRKSVAIGNIYDNGHDSQSGRVYSENGKSVTLKAEAGGGGAKSGLYLTKSRIRRLTPRECLRLQTVPEPVIDMILASGTSDTQIYKMAGNGFTIEVFKHILTNLNT